ncbi:Kelch domain-containing protein 1 [Aphelenchoides besseyi]|nr:Kelch domain-containing protein 1 [Aphelenchoides besseyi]
MSLDSEPNESTDYPSITLRLTSELSPVAGHMATSYRGCLLVCGGYHESSTTEFRKCEDLFVLPYGLAGNLGVWLKIKCSQGNVPKTNCGGTALIVRDSMYVFGGAVILAETVARRRNVSSSALYRLDLKTGKWHFIHISSDQKVPTPRDKMAAWTTNENLYFFGGYGARLSRLDNCDSYLYEEDDYEDGEPGHCWNNQLLRFDVSTNKWTLLPKLGDVPSHRAAAGGCYVSDLHSAFLFGGRHESGRLNDLYCLNMFTMFWTRIELDYKPVGRSWCTFTPLLDRKMIVMQGGISTNEEPLGDVWNLDLTDLHDKEKIRNGTSRPQWKCVRETDPIQLVDPNDTSPPTIQISPFRRFWHTAVRASEDSIIVYGGMSSSPQMAAPCLNSLNLEQLQPCSLSTICIRRLNRSSLRILSPKTLIKLRRKIEFLSDLRRFKTARTYMRTADQSFNRSCSSLSGLNIEDIFEITDPEYIWSNL